MKNNTEIKKLIEDFNRNLPVSGMALAYLMGKGSERVHAIDETVYEAEIDKQIAETEAKGAVSLMTKGLMLSLLQYAKKLAAYEPIVLVAALGNGIYQNAYLTGIYEDDVIVGKATCPYCGGNHFTYDEEHEDETVRLCADCDSLLHLEELNLEVSEN